MGALTTVQHGAIAASWREKIDTIKSTVAKGASDAQLEMFLTIADRYGLDPFLKQIWFVPSVGIMTSRDGYIAIAQRDPNYDGIVSAAVCNGDDFEIDPVNAVVKHKFGPHRGDVIGAYAVARHKKRNPCVTFADMREYAKSSPIWKQYPSAMICKVAEVLALKRQFGISGLVTSEEIGDEPTGSRAAQAEVLEAKLIEAGLPKEQVDEAVQKQASAYEPKRKTKAPAGVDMGTFFASFEQAKEKLGRELYYKILGAYGYEKCNQIPDRETAQRIWKEAIAPELKAIKEAELGVSEADLPPAS